MSWKNVEQTGLSLRGRMVLSTFFITGCLSILATVVVAIISYRYLIGDIEDMLNLISKDLHSEYRQYGGLTPEFKHCIDEDAEEHDTNKTFILVTDATNTVRYESPIPIGFRNRLLRLNKRGRTSGRFYTEREGLEDASRHGAVRFTTRQLSDGGHLILARDVSDLETFLIFLVSTLGGVSFLITLLSCISSYLVAGRILRLNQLVAEKDAAYNELRHLTDDIAEGGDALVEHHLLLGCAFGVGEVGRDELLAIVVIVVRGEHIGEREFGAAAATAAEIKEDVGSDGEDPAAERACWGVVVELAEGLAEGLHGEVVGVEGVARHAQKHVIYRVAVETHKVSVGLLIPVIAGSAYEEVVALGAWGCESRRHKLSSFLFR